MKRAVVLLMALLWCDGKVRELDTELLARPAAVECLFNER